MVELGGKDVQFVHAKSASTPEKKKSPEPEKDRNKKKKKLRRDDDETTEIPIIHGIPGDHLEVKLPPPNSIAEVLEPISRVIYKEKTYRKYDSEVVSQLIEGVLAK